MLDGWAWSLACGAPGVYIEEGGGGVACEQESQEEEEEVSK